MSDKKPDDELIGKTIAGRYRIISRLGAGGMGVAYRAWDEDDGVPVVIKIPKKAFLDDPKFAERFAREIRLLQGLRHPHIVPIVDVGEHEELPYVAMRFLPGGSLSNRRLRGDDGKPRPNPTGMLHLWLPAVADALDHVHANGVVHRDVKPGNIFFDAFWGAFLGDFGIAKIVEESESFDRENTLTATNMGIGTQEYMGPEQFTPKPLLDGRTDQYALAVMVYEMLAGTRPFTGTTAHLIVEVTTMPVPRLDRQRTGLPASLVQAVHRGLAKNPGDRFSTCREFAYEVLRDVPLLADEPDVARLLCPKCSNILKLPVAAAGQRGKCPKCQTQMKVADDLGALWLLDEARRQRRSQATVVDVEDIEDDQESVETGSEIDEDALEAFKPVSSTTPIERAVRKQGKKASTGMIIGGLAAAVVALAALLMIFGGGGEKPVPPVTYEQKLAQAQENLRLNPNDTDANEFLGRHWCFKKDDWKKGLPYLAKSGAIGLWNTAKKQLDLEAANPAASPGDRVRIVEDWWTLSGQKAIVSAAEAEAIKKHAAAIYMAAVDGLTDSKDIDDTSRWLEGNPEFLAMAGGKRPPMVKPKFPEGAIAFNGHTYFFPRDQTNQIEARLAAEKLGGGLVVIDDADENAFIAKNVHGPTWIGIGKVKNTWVHLAGGVRATFFSWDGGQPSNGPGEVAAAIWGNGAWHDHFGTDQLFYVVEWPEALNDATPGKSSPTPSVSEWVTALSRRANAATIASANGGGGDTEQAVDRALNWIVQHQMPDGGWSFDLANCPSCMGKCSHSGESKAADRCGATALAMLPFLGRGYTHREGPYKKPIEAGIGFLVQMAIAGKGKAYAEGGNLYSQGLAGIALSECFDMSQDNRLMLPTQAVLNFIMASQDPVGGGWRYLPRERGDTSASGWQIMALKSGNMAYLQVNPLTVKKAVEFLDSVKGDENGSGYGYTGPGDRPGTSAVGLLCRMYLGWKKDNPGIQEGTKKLAKIGPTKDLYYDYYATQIMHHMQGDMWISWNNKMKAMLLKTQSNIGHESGSWYQGVDEGEGPLAAGRLYCTALASLILEVYYRDLPIYRNGEPSESDFRE